MTKKREKRATKGYRKCSENLAAAQAKHKRLLVWVIVVGALFVAAIVVKPWLSGAIDPHYETVLNATSVLITFVLFIVEVILVEKRRKLEKEINELSFEIARLTPHA